MKGRIIKVFGQIYTVEYDGKSYNCVLRGKFRRDKRLESFSGPAVTGDIVDFDFDDNNEGIIETVHERRNIFSRKEHGSRKEDIIASNLDLIVVIQSFKNPRLNLRFVDRLLIRGEKEKIPVLLCANKSDLAAKKDIQYVDTYYAGTGISVIKTSVVKGRGFDVLLDFLADRISIFTGNSGVGKSSIINLIMPETGLRITPVSESTGKGKHTTTNVEMVSSGAMRIIDTPGLREFGLPDIDPPSLGYYFTEFRKYAESCNFRACTHDHEPGCEVKKQVEAGNINHDRYISYLNIYNSLKENLDNLY